MVVQWDSYIEHGYFMVIYWGFVGINADFIGV